MLRTDMLLMHSLLVTCKTIDELKIIKFNGATEIPAFYVFYLFNCIKCVHGVGVPSAVHTTAVLHGNLSWDSLALIMHCKLQDINRIQSTNFLKVCWRVHFLAWSNFWQKCRFIWKKRKRRAGIRVWINISKDSNIWIIVCGPNNGIWFGIWSDFDDQILF